VVLLLVGGCDPGSFVSTEPRPVPSVTQSARPIDEAAFWALIEDAQARGQDDPDRIADALDYTFYDASDITISTFQDQLAAASRQLYTWRHGEAAELICGGLDPDGFAAWRYWVIAQGRQVFEHVVAEPDALAALTRLDDSCGYWFDPVGWAAGNVWTERHPNGFPALADLTFTGDPAGTRLHGDRAIRAALPKLAARYS
jgi:hypothetical protein